MLLEPRLVKLTTRTGIEIRRTLPNAKKRTIGAWCFVDHFGPTLERESMVVAAHPHTGLQTATWLFSGSVEHRDSIGTVQAINPGQLNLMTAGLGISHSELSSETANDLHAVQLWIALPDSVRNMKPNFQHVEQVPSFEVAQLRVKLFAGKLLGHESQATIYSELIGAELQLAAGARGRLPMDSAFEHGVLVVQGAAKVYDELVELGNMAYLPKGPTELVVESVGDEPLVVIFLGGEPFEEEIVMWWNFIARSHDEIVAAREQWNQRDIRFGEFEDRIGGWIPAPELPNITLRSRKDS
ncbi:MAG: hypothetical protein RLZZ229_488 [Actinomycetota bacterium]|jgi:quercetin 2,3-dioxygenase